MPSLYKTDLLPTGISYDLFHRYLHNQCSEQETELIIEAFSSEEIDEATATMLQNYLQHDAIETAIDQHILAKNLELIKQRMNKGELTAPAVHRIHFLKTAWFRYAAAIIIICGIGAYLWNNSSTQKPAITHYQPVPIKNDVLPGSDKAMLTLSDGKKVELNNAASETIKDGDLAIRNNDGQLIYVNSERGSLSLSPKAKREEGGLNTMTTPKGGQYKITLADGTKVWLNAASSITFPTAFRGNARELSISGEAYLDVKQDKSKPFIVKTRDDRIEVLGTEFNVNAYEDERVIKTSLVEGSVKIGSKKLKPGEAYVNGKIMQTDIGQDIAWKNGIFDFNNKSLDQVMKQLSRWYNIEVSYPNGIPDKAFIGKMSRSLNLSDVLEFLKGSKIEFTLEEKHLIINK